MNIIQGRRKLKSVFYSPSTLVYFIFGQLGYFPIGRIVNESISNLTVYCISLKKSPQRRRFIKNQVIKAGFRNFSFVDGVDGDLLDVDKLVSDGIYDDSMSKKYHDRSLRPGEIACSLSHGLVYDTIIEKKHSISLILEDDALFISWRLNKIDFDIFPDDWDVVFLSSFFNSVPPKGRIRNNLFSTESWAGSSAAYLLSLKGASKLSKNYKPVFHAADGFLGRCIYFPFGQDHEFKQKGAKTKINAYLIYPEPILNGTSVGFWNSTLNPLNPSVPSVRETPTP